VSTFAPAPPPDSTVAPRPAPMTVIGFVPYASPGYGNVPGPIRIVCGPAPAALAASTAALRLAAVVPTQPGALTQ